MFLHQKCIFRKKKFPKSLSVQKLLVPLQPQISKVVFAQMAESVDALVSNTSGAIHPGSIPGLGTKMRVCHKSMAHPLLCYLLYNPRSIVAYSKKGII